jgi:CheY-like chemotaxis protein
MKTSVSNKLNCLLVDDDSEERDIFCMALEDMGENINCIHADNGMDALEKLRSQNFIPDFIFIDMNMPRMNGNQCLEEIKKITYLEKVPVYMYSASAEPEIVAETKRLGAAGFIVKPGSVAELTKTLNFCLK